MTEENKPVVAFLGPRASYTHQATLDVFATKAHTLNPLTTIEDIFCAVQSGTATRGVVPFENSSNGSVVFTLDLFADLAAKYPDILVCGESYIAVQHCLLGRHSNSVLSSLKANLANTSTGPLLDSPLDSGACTPTPATGPFPSKPHALPLGSLSRIKKIYSHPQAWGQCKTFLNTYLKGVERLDVSSTSRAAELVALDERGTSAAVSSGIAAQVHGLDVLARGIEDRGDNTTRFLVIRNAKGMPSGKGEKKFEAGVTGQEERADGDGAGSDADFKTLISFTVDHHNPGALAQCLNVFSKYGLNLTSINTRPSGVENWNYIFFVEIMGRRAQGDDGGEGAVNKALKELDVVSRGWRWLGSWRNRLVR